jgi:two-component system sensor histidine kinase/response regulator
MKSRRTNRKSTRRRMILMAFGLGALYWIVGSAADVYIFQEGELIEEIFTLDPHKVWMRSLVLCTLIMFSIYALSVISERKKIEKALKESEQRFKRFTSVVTDVIYRYDPKNNRYDFISPSFELQTGYSLEEIQADPSDLTRRITHPEDAKRVFSEVDDHIKKGPGAGPFSTEYRVIRKDGMIIWVSDKKDIEFSPGGGVYRINGVVRDITERRRMEDALRESEEKHRTLVEHSLQGLAVVQDFQIVFVNTASAEITGYSIDELISLGPDEVRSLVHTDDQKFVWKRFQDRLDGKSVSPRYEYRLNRKDGRIRWVEMFASRIDYRGKPAIQAALVDITERKHAEEALRETNARLETLIQAIPDVVYVKDVQGCNLVVNKAYEELVTLQQAQIVGKTDEEVLPPSLTHQCQLSDDEVMSKREPIRCEEHFTHEDDQRIFFETIKAPLYDDAGKLLGLVGVSRDITERKRVEENLKNAKKEAEEANRLKSEFLANMSHEIRTPMNAIIGMTDITLDTDLNDEQRDYLTTVKHSARALLELLNDILDLSKIEADRIELETIDFDLRVTVEGVLDTLAPKASAKELELACMIHQKVPSFLRGDPGRLRQILVNLVGNAIKFTEEGEVVIGVELAEGTDDSASLLFSVTDTGIGIPKDKQTKIFESFTQADGSTTRKYGGSGLGLSICKRLVNLMGGEIGLESEPDNGSRFWFTATLEKQKEPKEDLPSISPDIKGMRILVVDDNKTNRTILVKMLESFGCSAEAVERGTEALRALKRAAHGEKLFDLVLLDMQMPGMDGEETLRAIKRHSEIKDVMVIILTSLGIRGDAARLQALGCAGYLVKPIKQSELFDTMITVLSRKERKSKEKYFPIVTRHTIAEQKHRKVRILVAEDNPMNQKLAMALLKKSGYWVDAVENGRMVIEKLNRRTYDLILMDVQMPEMDGFEATRIIRVKEGKKRHTPIIAMTAHAMKGDRERCLQAGMDDYVSKPIEAQKLFESIERWIDVRGFKKPISRQVKTETNGQTKDIPIDLETALDRLDQDGKLLKQMLQELLKKVPNQLQILEKAVNQGDNEAVEREAHSLKGAAGNLGAKYIADFALKLELSGRKGDLADATQIIEKLRTEFKRLDEYFHQSLNVECELKS